MIFLNKVFVIIGIGNAMQMTAERGLRFVLFRPNHRVESALAFADVSVAAKEIHRARPEAKQRREPRIVVIGFRDVTVLAIFCRADAAGRVRQMRIVSLTAITFRADGLLLRINPFAICVLRTHDDGA